MRGRDGGGEREPKTGEREEEEGAWEKGREDSKRKTNRPSFWFTWTEALSQCAWGCCSVVVAEGMIARQDGDPHRNQDKPLFKHLHTGWQIFHEINKKTRTKKTFLSISVQLKALSLSPCPFLLLGIRQTKEHGGYSWIKNTDYAEIHFTESLKTCLIR